jgi:hypothetical protein
VIYVADLEGDSLTPTKIHCLSVMNVDTEKLSTTIDYDEMRRFWLNAKVIIGHNFKRFDVRVVEKLLGIKIKCKIIDTLALSWYLYPARKKHGLEQWGEHYGVPKPIITDWEDQPIETYIHRCEEDVKINFKLWKDQFRYLVDLYGSQAKVWKFLDYISFKMDCAVLQEKSGWKVDQEYLNSAIKELQELKDGKFQELIEAMPPVPKYKTRSKPKRFINSNGDYSKLGLEWLKFLDDHGLPPHHEEDVPYVTHYEKGNPDAPQQVKDWLYANGWVPQTFDYKKDKATGEVRPIPQINLDHGKGICHSIKMLYEKEPKFELLDGLSVITHRLGVLKGIKKGIDERGYTKAQIQGFTNTLRVKHTTVVNLPKVDKPYGEFIRGALIAEDGTVLCGSDMASLEDRIKQHFIYFYDPDYVNSMDEKGFDPHLTIAVIAGMCTQEDADNYKYVAILDDEEKERIKQEAAERKQNESVFDWAKRIKPVRDIAKNGNYA